MKVEAIINEADVQLVLIDGHPATKIKRSGRQVFVHPSRVVIKFDNYAKAWDYSDQTINELEFVDRIEEEDKKFFCLPLKWGFIKSTPYIVQEMVFNETEPTIKDVEELNFILKKYKLLDIGYCEMTKEAFNCAFTLDGWKIYDYGIYEK